MTIQEFNEHFNINTAFYETTMSYVIEITISHKTIPFKLINRVEWSLKFDTDYSINCSVNKSINLFNNTLKELSKIKEYGKAACLITATEDKHCIEWDNTLNCWFSVDENNNKIY